MPAPDIVRTVTGSVALPPNMYRIFASWLTISSMHSPMKSMNIMSTIGLRPVAPAPTASPMMPDSLMGVSITRSGPNSSSRPR